VLRDRCATAALFGRGAKGWQSISVERAGPALLAGGLLDGLKLLGLLLQLTGDGLQVFCGVAQLAAQLEALRNRGAVSRCRLINLGEKLLVFLWWVPVPLVHGDSRLLLADPNGPPPLSLLPPPKPKPPSGGKDTGSTGGKAGTAELHALEQRLVRLEQLVLLIAQQMGVSPDAIERLPPAALPPT